MKKITSIFLCALLICICVVPVSATDVITKPNQTLKDVKNPLVLDFDGEITINGGNINAGLKTYCESAITIAPGRDVTIVIPGGKTLSVKGCDACGYLGAGAGIEVPSSSKLTIIGSGTLNASGGSACVGGQGQSGEDAYITDDWYCHSGAGGDGGAGGGGAGAGIGSKGGDGGDGGKGGEAIEVYANSSVYRSGNSGGNGGDGHRPDDFGEIKISNNIHLTAKGGPYVSSYSSAGGCGNSASKQDWWYYAAYGGGGGVGGGGYEGKDIGSGGYGGGGAGGGGGGLTYRFYYKTSLDAADGTGQGGKFGYGHNDRYYAVLDGAQKENKGLDKGYGGGAGGHGGDSEPWGAWDAEDVFFDENLVGSIVSSGSLPIVIGGACVVLALVIVVVIKKKTN